MRLKSDIWVKAYLRRCAFAGVPGYVVRHGDDGAGAIFIKVSLLDGRGILFGPAPAGMDWGARDRVWVGVFGENPKPEHEIEAYLEKQMSYDEDIWIVEIEDRDGRHFLNDSEI